MRWKLFACLLASSLFLSVNVAAARGYYHHHRHHHQLERVIRDAVPAYAACDNNGRCSSQQHQVRHNQRTADQSTSRRCPASLGCGCHLAEYLGFGPRRDLWVARNYAHEGHAASRGCIGCVAVLSRGRHGGHVGRRPIRGCRGDQGDCGVGVNRGRVC